MEGDGTLVNGIGGNFSDVANSFPEPQEKCLQVQPSADDDDEEKEGQNVSDGQIRALHSRYLVIEALHRQCLDLQRMPASSPGINGKINRLRQTLIQQQSWLDEKARPETYRMLADLKMFMGKNTEAVNLLKKEGDDTLVNGISGNFSDVANSFPEPPAEKCLQVQSSADDDEEKEEGRNVSDVNQIKALRRQCSDLHRMLASSPGINGKIYRLQQTVIRQTLKEEKAWAEIGRMLEDVKMSMRKNTEAVNFSKEDDAMRSLGGLALL